jgi:hypothetical protein
LQNKFVQVLKMGKKEVGKGSGEREGGGDRRQFSVSTPNLLTLYTFALKNQI